MRSFPAIVYLVGFFYLSSGSYALPVIRHGMNENFVEFLESIREIMVNGSPENEIPVLDPLDLKSASFKFESRYLDFDLHAKNVKLTGLSDFEFRDVDLNLREMRVHYNFSLPFTVVDAEKYYFLGLVFKALPIYGNGRARFEASDLRIDGYSDIKTDSHDRVEFLNFSFDIRIGALKSETNGMLGGGDIDSVINQILADLGPDFIAFYSEEIAGVVTDLYQDKFNKLIHGTTLDDLVELLG